MTQHVVVIDTSILCCFLKVPGKDTAGPEDDFWDYDRTSALLAQRRDAGAYFVLPFATIVETGNHISQAAGDRHALARSLSDLIEKASKGDDPWIAFAEQANLLTDKLPYVKNEWPELAARRISIGDYLIKDVAEYYAKTGMMVEIITGDQGLKSFQPSPPAGIRPRRRR